MFVSLLVAAFALYTSNTILLPFAAVAMLWGHYWDASNVMTIPSMVAKPEYRGTASGFAYMFVNLPSFLAIFLFPEVFTAIGQANATLLVAIFPLIGLLAAIFILPEVIRVRARRGPRTRAAAGLKIRRSDGLRIEDHHVGAAVGEIAEVGDRRLPLGRGQRPLGHRSSCRAAPGVQKK